MGLFNRKNPYEKDALDLEAAMRDAPERPDPRVRQPLQPQQQAPVIHNTQVQVQPHAPQAAAVAPPQAAAPAPKSTYGIEDAIRLMRELPDSKKEMVITIVQKTLVSAKINVNGIIDDAARKIDRLEKKNEKLGQEVRELEEAILQRKMEIERNGLDIEETNEVKVSFESIHPRAEEPAPVARPQLNQGLGSHLPQTAAHAQPLSSPQAYIPNQKAG